MLFQNWKNWQIRRIVLSWGVKSANQTNDSRAWSVEPGIGPKIIIFWYTACHCYTAIIKSWNQNHLWIKTKCVKKQSSPQLWIFNQASKASSITFNVQNMCNGKLCFSSYFSSLWCWFNRSRGWVSTNRVISAATKKFKSEFNQNYLFDNSTLRRFHQNQHRM